MEGQQHVSVSRLTKKYQATIPAPVREALGIGHGDQIAFVIEGDRVMLRRAAPIDWSHAAALEPTLSEWLSHEDDEAYRDL